MKIADTHRKTIVKTISYRVISTIALVGVVWVVTDQPLLSIGIGAIDVILKMALYYVHERVWTKIHF